MQPPRPAFDWWPWILGSWLATALIALSSLFTGIDRHWLDLNLRWLSPSDDARSVLVVDIDEASMRALAARGQPWPFGRDVHAAAARRLFDLGARAVVFNLLFAEPRPGDEALSALAADAQRPVVLAADVSNEFRPALDEAARSRLQALAAPPGSAAPAASRWEGLLLPTPVLLAGARHLGVQRTALDSDGRLRCLHAWHQVEGQVLPALVTAALQMTSGAPGDAACITPLLRTHTDALRVVSLVELLDAQASAALASSVKGRTVFIGSPSVLDAQAMTPVGQIAGTWWQALAYEAIHNGEVLAPRRPVLDAALLLIAGAPLLLGLRRRVPDVRRDAAASALALLAMLALVALLLWRAQPVGLPAALLLLLAGGVALAGRWMRRQALDRQQARVDSAAAQAAERATSQFLAHMSHEVRTPLNAMLGVTQLLGETPMSPLQRRYVETMGHAGAHLTRLIDDVLDLSRWEAGGVTLQRQPFSPRALVEELRSLFEPQARAKTLHLSAAVDDACPALVLGDAHRVRQVLMNLLGNATKFTGGGSVSLEVMAAADRQGLEITVRDTGIGIAADRLAMVFEPFMQADAGVAQRFGGSGLGLAITRRLVVAMGGEIRLESAAGSGTTARVKLPLPACEAPQTPAHGGSSTTPLGGKRLLLAEDNEVNVMVVQGMLRDSGVLLDIARDGREAVGMAIAQRYDLVLMDLLMPHLDGHEATRAIRADETGRGLAPVPVIALSANTQASDLQASLAAGCLAHLGKPVEKATLLAAISQALEAAQPVGEAASAAPPATS